MTLHLDLLERPSAAVGRKRPFERQPSHWAEREHLRPRPFLAQAVDYPARPITSHLDMTPALVVAVSIIVLKLFMLALLLYAL